MKRSSFSQIARCSSSSAGSLSRPSARSACASREYPTCPHGVRLVCFARHEETDARLGTPLCLDCYDHDAQVVWNMQATELWRRTTIAIRRHLRRRARTLGVDPDTIKLAYGKAAEMQRRAVAHFHAVVRLDGADPNDKDAILRPPAGLGVADLVAAIEQAVRVTGFATEPHPANPDGWHIRWGAQLDLRVITVAADGPITEDMVAAYIAKYATKSTEVTGHVSGRLNEETVTVYADPDGNHTERLIEACWIVGRPKAWRRLRLWAHMLGFGGHFFTKSRRYSVTFTFKRQQRIMFRRTVTTGPTDDGNQPPEEETTLVVNFLQFVGAGWHTTGDALLANTSAALAREHQSVTPEELVAFVTCARTPSNPA